uniref:Uncharacterized protein n=1 Tax=Nomascus leucogenys TaxID=61853 RepID=A0A2I3HN51_NOMLE
MVTRFLGPRDRELVKNWIPTAYTWGAVGAVGLVWATDWRLILDWDDGLQLHPYCCKFGHNICFYGCIVFHGVYVPYFLYPVSL